VRSVRREHGSRVRDRLWGLGKVLIFLVALSLSYPVRDSASWQLKPTSVIAWISSAAQ
jgi:hypothetical protein